MTNREKLEQAEIIKSDTVLSSDQSEAIESLTAEDIEGLISARNKLTDAVDDFVLGVPGILTHKMVDDDEP